MITILEKWINNIWEKDPSDGIAYSGEVVYAKGDEEIEASTAINGCRIVLFYDEIKEKAAILHINQMNDEQYKILINAVRIKKFNISNSKVYLCGDEVYEDQKSWNDAIELYLNDLKYETIVRITNGRGKEVVINPGQSNLSIKDSIGRNLI